MKTLEDLSQDAAIEEVSPYLSGMQELASLTQTSRGLKGLFQQPLLARKAAKLLTYVVRAEYEKAALAVRDDPATMFERVDLLSPLEEAFKQYDTYMWQIFLNAIQRTHDQVLLKQFSATLQKPINHINLNPLYAAYERYDQQYSSWIYHDVSDQQIDEAWLHLGVSQREHLPWSVLRLMCDGKTCWDSQASFIATEQAWPRGECKIRKLYGRTSQEMVLMNHDLLGLEFTLARGGGLEGVCCAGLERGVAIVSRCRPAFDLVTIRRLLAVRTAEFAQLRENAQVISSLGG